ncbi:MAG: 50S ribosomal protein L7/L12 [Candidatus Cloacimonadota bacterium]|nr:MAG: 50S ribosomal protein L7/L12 [Candidatus Cloacimonadota bacterium]
MADKKQQVIDIIKEMSVIELSELVKELEEIFDITAAAPVAVAAPGAATGGEAAEEKTEFDVVLTSSGAKKIQVIKTVRAITKLGLKEAKELVDNAPNPVVQGVSKEEAETVKAQIEEAGGSVEVK